jgi:hypothetical protein
MDDPGDRKNNQKIQGKGKKTGPLQRYISNVSDVLSPVWLRRIVQINNGFEWFVLGSRYNFLFNFRLFLVVVFLIVQIFK